MLFGVGGDEVGCSTLRKVLLIRNPTLTLGLSKHCEGTAVVLVICNSENAKARRRGRVSLVDLVSSPFLSIPPI